MAEALLLVFLIAALVTLDALALRFGADSRTLRSGRWPNT